MRAEGEAISIFMLGGEAGFMGNYYYENIEELNAEIKTEEQFVEEMKKLYPSMLRRKRG